MRWVKLTLPPRPRRRWLLMMMRLSMSSLAGTARTLVAVGSSSDCSMLATMRAAMPLSGLVSAPAAGAGPVAGLAAAGLAAAGAGACVGAGTALGVGVGAALAVGVGAALAVGV